MPNTEGGEQEENVVELQTVVPAGGDEEPVTEEEKARMIAHVQQQCTDLQQLMKRLADSQREMQDYTMDFILRDIEEENRHIASTNALAAQDRINVSNTEYHRWLQDRVPTSNDVDWMSGSRIPCFLLSDEIAPYYVGWKALKEGKEEAVFSTFDAPEDAFPAVVFVNGRPLTDRMLTLAKEEEAVKAVLSFCSGSTSPAETCWKFQKFMWAACALKSNKEVSVSIIGSEAARSALRCDGSDAVSLVPLRAIRDGLVIVRAFATNACVIGIETLGPKVNLLQCLGVAPEDVTVLLTHYFQQKADIFQGNSAATFALVRGQGSIVPLLLSVRKLAPHVLETRDGYFSWTDICGMAGVEKGEGWTPEVRTTELPVVELAPYDSTSAEWYPVLNGGQAAAKPAAQHKDPQPEAVAPTAPSGVPLPLLLASVGVATAAVSVFVTRKMMQ